MDARRFGDLRENMKPDPQTLATRYRLNLLPKKRNFALVKKPRKKASGQSSSNENSDGGAKPKSPNTGGRGLKTDENKTGQEAVYISTTCWKIEEAADDESNSEDDFDDDLRPDSHHSNKEFQAQQTYHTMCKVLCIRPIKNFHNSLVTDTVAVCYQALNHDEMKACATALVHTDNVEKVIFDDNNLGPLGTARLAEILPLKIEFRELTIKNNKIGSDGAKLLCTALLNNNHIRKLDLSGNEFCEDDGEAFGELLEVR
ncbi:leucine-rich repeat-containing protein 74A [Elysia marginata]|uniref:Leucine-rich repeat-containing protein 74A n=1 Tax=Elysia marginata TaxID=1093978 RepID=A0AAV4GKD7_9GAST|nr:leucine-rich repeat-containing protein 74A [Elysia marginata]